MIDGSNLSKKITAYSARAQYDAEAKKVLADKLLLSYILAYTVDEYAGMNLADIIDLIEDVKVSEVSIEPGETNNPDIKGDNNEDKVPHEGSVYFDVRFHVWKPDKSERIKIIIDVEAQRKFRLDIPNIVLVCLSQGLVEDRDEFKLHRLLETVFSENMKPAEKKKLIENEYDIAMSENLERGIKRMFDFSESIWERGVNEGVEIGRSEGIEAGKAEIVRNMYGQKCSPEQISTLTGVNLKTVQGIISDANVKTV